MHTVTEEGISITSDRVLQSGTDEENYGQEAVNLIKGFEVSSGAEYLADIDTFTIDGINYFYTVKDHLSSPRVTFTDANNDNSPEVTNIQDYYAFGLEYEDTTTEGVPNYRQSYNDKEAVSYTNYLEFEARGYIKSINLFDGPDPISQKFPHLSTTNYASLSPVANIDLWGLQAYYSADGNFIGNVGDSEEKRIINNKNISGAAAGLIVGQASTSEKHANFLTENSIQGFNNMDAAAMSFACEACTQDDVADVEYGAKIGSLEVTNEDGSQSTLFSIGTTATGGQDSGGDYVDFNESKLPDGFKTTGAVHTHTSRGDAENFSPYRNPNNYFEYGDGKTVFNVGGTLYLATPSGKLKVLSTNGGNGVTEKTVSISLPKYNK